MARRLAQLAPGLTDEASMTAPLVLRTALGRSPLVRALKDGTIASDRVGFDLVEVDPITRAFRRMTRALEFDLCEMALTTHAQARAFGKPITALPVVLLRGLHHGALVCRRDSPLRGPADLRGKRVGVRAWSQTTGVWVRGILHDEYGVAPDSMTWVTEEEAHVQEFTDPPFVQRIAAGQDLRAMLLSGEIDAAVALAGIDPAAIRTVIPDAEAAAIAWSKRTGVYPINHVVVVKDALLAENPWLSGELMRLFLASKSRADDTVPYGVATNRPAIELLMRYAAEQGLIPRAYAVEELFVA
jgi:4,5-dihydroxyphthalate decarboxylase